MPLEEDGWGTTNEQRYIDLLVSGAYRSKDTQHLCPDPKILLTNYIKSAQKRKELGTFGAVKADQVIEYAKATLKYFKIYGG